MPKPDFEKEIQEFVDAEVTEHERRGKVMVRLSRLHQRLVARVKAGASTGDIARDFMLCCGHGFPETQREEITKKLQAVQTAVASHVGQPALIVVTEREGEQRGCMGGSMGFEHRSYYLGTLTGPSIVLDIPNASWKLPTSHYASQGPIDPVWKSDGPMSAHMTDMLTWYGFNTTSPRRSVEFIIGAVAIDKQFCKHFEHEQLERLAKAIGLPMGLFPNNSQRLAGLE